ncbi:hypothetical protein [Rhodococcus globerulus]|uniref:Phage protein n=1 Tax=Rhodococcus globerulus TaxID=33008 RepID=A0ABU4BS68_RHOGO|nr:hypothetical protein [Rhodococcus globerulus]MDV6267070.1 hypothetical protein [Rhodococcus globerulus]
MSTKPYTIEIHGIPHTVLLSDDEADKRGLTVKAESKPVATKGRQPGNKAAVVADKADSD